MQKEKKWVIVTNMRFGEETEMMYLGWQNPVWDDDGYFWTYKDVIQEIVGNSTPEHTFLFNSRHEAIKYLKTLNIPQRCTFRQILCAV